VTDVPYGTPASAFAVRPSSAIALDCVAQSKRSVLPELSPTYIAPL
jgi:hypothetical protein